MDQTSGQVAVSWYDCRADTNNVKTRFYAAVSLDGGEHFSKNIQLEAGQSDATMTWPPDYDYFDYTGLAYHGGILYPAWADNSNVPSGNPDFPDFCGSCTNRQMDIYVGRLHY